MIFSSYIFLVFLIAVVGIFFVIHTIAPVDKRHHLIKYWLLSTSVFFYAFWGIIDFVIVACSLLLNYVIGQSLLTSSKASQRALFCVGILLNLGLIAYFKYANFLLQPLNYLVGPVNEISVFLPLGISFYTFQQIAYLMDCRAGKNTRYNLLDYSLFVMFFPQLVAGPIVSHRKIIPQLVAKTWERICWRYVALGMALFSIGLFKKAVLADNLALLADSGYEHASTLGLIDAWITTLSYSFQLYFDFSGYSDMALGVALILGIHLPINFNSPFKAGNIQQFWGAWNITLGNFFRDYLFKSMGGFRRERWRQNLALFLNMMLVGLWHGASWLFVLWGALHGVALIIHRFWRKLGINMPHVFNVMFTFLFVHFALVLFRAEDVTQALQIYHAMISNSITIDVSFFHLVESITWLSESRWFPNLNNKKELLLILILSTSMVFLCKNSNAILTLKKPSIGLLLKSTLALIIGMLFISGEKEFIYFVF